MPVGLQPPHAPWTVGILVQLLWLSMCPPLHGSCSDVWLRAEGNSEVGVQSPTRAIIARDEVILTLATVWVCGGGYWWLPEEPVTPLTVAKTLVYRDHVWVYWSTRKKDPFSKLSNHWVGPCKVLEQVLVMVYHTIGKWRDAVLRQDQLAPYWPFATLWDEAMENIGSHSPDVASIPAPYHHPLIHFISCSTCAGHLGDLGTVFCALGCLDCLGCHVSRTFWLVALPTFTSDYETVDNIMTCVWFNNWVPGQVYI